jgi:CHASE3 domain sensor protein
MPITSRFFVQSTTALLLVGLLALLGIVGMTFWLGARAQVYFNEVIEARDARSSAVDLRNAVQTAESSQRGFLFTGNEIYLAPYNTAKALALRQLDEVNRMAAAYRGADASVARLTTIIHEKFNEMDQSIALKRDRRDADALAIVRSNRGKALMDEANVFFSGIIRAADERLTTGVGEQKTNASLLRWFSIVGGIVIATPANSAARATRSAS